MRIDKLAELSVVFWKVEQLELINVKLDIM